jgi:hypothetical protein
MTDIILTQEEADSLKIQFGWIIKRKLEQTKWVLENKKDEESVKLKKEQMEKCIVHYDNILKKIGWEDKSKLRPTVFSFKKARPHCAG